MTSLLGWSILAASLYLLSAALLLPALVAVRRRLPRSRTLLFAAWAAPAIGAVALWFLIPLVVWWTMGRAAH
jgi:hypothetical protein